MLNFSKIIFSLFFICFLSSTFSYYDKVEDIFEDININYKYIHELQSLYDNGAISPDENNKFNPNKLLSRDDFVGVVMEVSCKKCIKPNTALEYINKYTGKDIFFDLDENNKNFYCIAEAKEINVVKGYLASHKCEDGTTKNGYAPFCTNNNITLEEAVAVLLRNSSVFTIEDNNNIINQIKVGNIIVDLSKDVHANVDGTPYTFYGYFKKAIEMSYSEYDIYGTLKKYSLVSLDGNGNLNPKKCISKEEFLKMSYIISKMNSCSLKNNKSDINNSSIAGKIDIYDKKCTDGDTNCSKSNLKDPSGIYDFTGDIKTICDKGIKDYTWILYNKNTKKMYTKKGKYLDNYKLKSYGIWQIKLITKDNCGNTLEVYSEVSYLDETKVKAGDNNLGVVIEADPIIGNGPLKVNFDSIIKNCDDCKYSWNFGDGNISTIKNPINIFIYAGIYEIELVITDKYGNKVGSTVIIKVKDNYNYLINKINEIDAYLKDKSSIAGKIDIYDKKCLEGDTNCSKSNLKDPSGIYDFSGDVKTTCEKGIKEYTWVLYNKNTKETYTEKGKYLDNYKLKSYGIWQIKLITKDNCGNSIEIYNEMSYLDETKVKEGDNNLGVVIEANPIMGNGPLTVNFDSIVKNCDNCKYSWDFGNGNVSNIKNPTNIFKTYGGYEVILTITDKNGNTASSTVIIKVNENGNGNGNLDTKLTELKDLIKNGNSTTDINNKINEIDDYLKNKESTSGKIDIYDKKCLEGDTNCSKSNLKDLSGIYDFSGDVKTTCEKGIKEYTWVLYNKSTKETYTEKGKYLDNYKLKSYGIWQIKLIIKDNCGNTIESNSELSYLDETKVKEGDNNLGVVIEANPIMGNGPLTVNFDSIVKNCDNCKYSWDFGNGNTSNIKNPTNIYKTYGGYEVVLTITDKNGNTASSTIIIKVNENITDLNNGYGVNDKNIDTSKIDTDGDGIFDNDDKCILVRGDIKNSGCPILEDSCLVNSEKNTCKSGYVCNNGNGLCEVKKQSQELASSCIYPSNGSSVFGNMICDSCPCNYSIGFLSTIRKCDVILPTITSPDKKEIYGKGLPYQIPYSQ